MSRLPVPTSGRHLIYVEVKSMHTEHNTRQAQALAILFTTALLLNAMAPSLAYAAKQSQDVEQATKEPQGKTVMVMSRGQIDSSKITTGWYAHIVYISEEGSERIATGQIMEKGTDHILIRVEDEALKSWKTIAYTDMDTLVIAQHTRDIEEWKNARHTQRHGEQPMQQLYAGELRVRVAAPSIRKGWMVGKLIKMTQDTLVVRGGLTLYGRRFYQVPLSSISNFEVSTGQYRNTFEGMKIGIYISVGFIAIMAVGMVVYEPMIILAPDVLEIALFSSYVLVPITALTTVIGAMTKSDKWLAVSPQRLNLSISPTSTKGFRAALTFNF